MTDFMDYYFGPLSREYCIYFYYMSIGFGIVFVLTLFSILSFVIMSKNKIKFGFISNSVLVLVNIFLAYFVNRLLHTMCVKTI